MCVREVSACPFVSQISLFIYVCVSAAAREIIKTCIPYMQHRAIIRGELGREAERCRRRYTDRERERDRQTDRQTDGRTEGQINEQAARDRETEKILQEMCRKRFGETQTTRNRRKCQVINV